MSAPFSATMMVGAFVLPDVTARKNRGIDYSKIVQPVHLELRADDTVTGFATHAAGAHRMKHGASACADIGDHLIVGLYLASRADFFFEDFRKRRRIGKPA